ncbi:GNAT family N-acetyltransferase [uncultured Roseovarius sp.]|uniref:GNAT family N-acetyltransferase n=1 Tax=uncultured Roseovarius sp. TaxID=293344 RepID=UPI0025D7D814|nr:GNAT family N-acetyltransferase [uncultured Roseovarius sp.]
MTLPATISTERLVLRPFEMRDLDGYVAYYTGDRTDGVGGPQSRQNAVNRFFAMAGQWALRGYGRYAISLRDTAIGHAGVLHCDPADPAELTWTLWTAAQEGKGYATEAAQAVLAKWHGPALIARIAPENAASIRVAERIGMHFDPEASPPGYAPSMHTYRADTEAEGLGR